VATQTKRLRAPFLWFGGKGNMASKLLKLLPKHEQYVAPFFGSGALFFAKDPAQGETVNDLDSAVTGFFRVLRDRPCEFIRLARRTEYSRELWIECRDGWQAETDPVRRAWMWWFVAATSFSGRFGSSLSTAVTTSRRGMANTTSMFRSRVALLGRMADRLQCTQIENTDALTVMQRYCTPDSLCYSDPPYVHSTRLHKRYAHEMDDAAHAAFVAALLDLPGRHIVSGYDCEVYAPLTAAGWHRVDYQTSCYAAGRTRATGIIGEGSAMRMQGRTESVWLDPATAAEVLPAAQATLALEAAREERRR